MPIGPKPLLDPNISFIDTNYTLFEFESKSESKIEFLEIISDFIVDPFICNEFNLGQIRLKKGMYAVDYMNSEYGMIAVPIVKQIKTIPTISFLPDGNCCFNIFVSGSNSYNAFHLTSFNNTILSVNTETGYDTNPSSPITNPPNDAFDLYCQNGSFQNNSNSVGKICFTYTNNPFLVSMIFSTNKGVTFNTAESQEVILNCNDQSISCPGNLLQNFSFIDGGVQGAMPTGSVDNWTLAYGSPDVNVGAGCDYNGLPTTGFMNMWGNQVVGEAIQQTLALGNEIIDGNTYRIELCGRKGGDPNKPLPVQFEIRASNGPLNGPGGGELIGVTGTESAGIWTDFTFEWLATGNYNTLTISATNSSSADHGDSTSNGQIDNICIYEVELPDSCRCNENQNWDSKYDVSYTNPQGNLDNWSSSCNNFHNSPYLEIKKNTQVTINSLTPYNCLPTNEGCIEYRWKVIISGTIPVLIEGESSTPNVTFVTNDLDESPPNYTFVIYAFCGQQLCDSCGFRFVVRDSIADTCHCYKLSTSKVIKVTPSSGQTTTLNCMQYYTHYGANPTLNFQGWEWLCTPSYIPSTGKWEVYESYIAPSQLRFTSPPGINFSYDFIHQGTYCVKFYSMCCEEICDTGSVVIGRDTTNCECDDWVLPEPLQVETTKETITYNCGTSLKLEKSYLNSLKRIWLPYSAYKCDPNTCQVKYRLELYKMRSDRRIYEVVFQKNFNLGILPEIKFGSFGDYTLNWDNIYKIKFIPICGENNCPPCEFTIRCKK